MPTAARARSPSFAPVCSSGEITLVLLVQHVLQAGSKVPRDGDINRILREVLVDQKRAIRPCHGFRRHMNMPRGAARKRLGLSQEVPQRIRRTERDARAGEESRSRSQSQPRATGGATGECAALPTRPEGCSA
jgi:hypothetical protein